MCLVIIWKCIGVMNLLSCCDCFVCVVSIVKLILILCCGSCLRLGCCFVLSMGKMWGRCCWVIILLLCLIVMCGCLMVVLLYLMCRMLVIWMV